MRDKRNGMGQIRRPPPDNDKGGRFGSRTNKTGKAEGTKKEYRKSEQR